MEPIFEEVEEGTSRDDRSQTLSYEQESFTDKQLSEILSISVNPSTLSRVRTGKTKNPKPELAKALENYQAKGDRWYRKS